MAKAKKRQVRILPIDSEHSAVFSVCKGGIGPSGESSSPPRAVPSGPTPMSSWKWSPPRRLSDTPTGTWGENHH